MSGGAGNLTRSERAQRGPAIDGPTVMLALAIVLLGLVMVTSASITIAGRDGNPFAFLERQLLLVLIGGAAAAVTFAIPTERLEQLALPLLLLALLLLFVVLVPGLGHVVNGSRRWLRLAGMNFQVSEAARVLALIYVASYAVRYEDELRSGLPGLFKPLRCWPRSRCCCCSSRTSAPPACCSSPASACCSWRAHAGAGS